MRFYYYKITNIKNGSFYIGITTDIERRKKQHFTNLKNNSHPNYKMQKDYNIYGEENFTFKIIDEFEGTSDDAYFKEYQLIQSTKATASYNILEGGKVNPVYSPQVLERIKQAHQEKYDNILQYTFDGKQFELIAIHGSLRDAAKNTNSDFRAIQTCVNNTQSHHGYYWVKENNKKDWLLTFLNRHTFCVAKVNEKTNQIEDTALTIREFAEKYDTTYSKIYSSIRQNNRCERKYKFIRITANEFANINHLSL